MTKTILLLQNFVLFKMSDECEHSENKFYYASRLSSAGLLQSPTNSKSTERKSTLLTNEGVRNFLRSQQQGNSLSRKQLFQMSCRIINLWKANSLEAKLFSVESIKEFIVGQKQGNNVKKTKYNKEVFFEFPEFLGEVS